MPEFQVFPKIPRLSRQVTVTEKIDGTNAQVYIPDSMDMVLPGSRKKWLTLESDNFGFAKWVKEHYIELLTGLGPGIHYGEWWGKGIQRGYGLEEKRFSLFNTKRWTDDVRPACCGVVPVLYEGPFDTAAIDSVLDTLRESGSVAAPGFMKPEGIVVYHSAANSYFKKTVERDDYHKEELNAQ